MKLWLLRPVGFSEGDGFWKFPTVDNPWNPWYDKAFGFVIRAGTEDEARKLADGEAGDENHDRPWLDPNLSVCEELTSDGPVEIVIRDFASA